jgi:hypothetical protein
MAAVTTPWLATGTSRALTPNCHVFLVRRAGEPTHTVRRQPAPQDLFSGTPGPPGTRATEDIPVLALLLRNLISCRPLSFPFHQALSVFQMPPTPAFRIQRGGNLPAFLRHFTEARPRFGHFNVAFYAAFFMRHFTLLL